MTVPTFESASERLAYRRRCHGDGEPLLWAQPDDAEGYALWYDCGSDGRRLTPDALVEVSRLLERYSAAPVTAWPRYGRIGGLDRDELRSLADRLGTIVRNPDNSYVEERSTSDGATR
jgi:hypothetical protein